MDEIERERRAHMRDGFAAAALAGLLAQPGAHRRGATVIAEEAFEMAEAMLVQRDKASS